jgi:hypothetical protein
MVVADPAISVTAPEAAWDATEVLCTVTVAPVEVTVGVTVTEATLFGTKDVYDVVSGANARLSDPWLSTRVVSVLTVLSTTALLTVTVYVLVVVVSWAVTSTAIAALLPAVILWAPDALPDDTVTPATFTVESASVVVGVTVTDGTPFATLAVYVVVADAKAGDSVP